MVFMGWIVISIMIVIIDQITKISVTKILRFGDSQAYFDFFNLVLVHNRGAAFSFLANESGWQRWFFTMVSVLAGLVIIWLLQKSYKQTLFASALSFILGGACGNLIDRLWHGYVIDFLDFHIASIHWPAFNVADVFISIGIGLLIIDEILRVRKA